MPILFIFSNLIFLILLIRCSIKGDSNQRFLVKTVTCFHFIFLAVWAVMTLGLKTNQGWLLGGLGCAFLGDVALGLKHKGSWAFGLGLLFFGLSQLFYILHFGFNELTLVVFVPFTLVLVIVTGRLKDDPAYDFKTMGRFLFVYACAMILMMNCALSQMILNTSKASLIQALGAVLFVSSDVILMNLYYRKDKKTGMIPVYLILYHAAQNLMALSLWFI